MRTHSPYHLATQAYLTALVCAFPLSASAQTGDIPKPVIQNLSKDLSQLQQAVLDAQNKLQAHDVAASKDGSTLEKLTVTAPTYIRAGAAENAPAITKASAGERYQVIDKVGDWYAITIPKTAKGIDSGWVSATAAVPISPQRNSQISASISEQIFVDLTERAARFKQSYQDNPYVNVTGFTVNVFPPSLSVNFEFKK